MTLETMKDYYNRAVNEGTGESADISACVKASREKLMDALEEYIQAMELAAFCRGWEAAKE